MTIDPLPACQAKSVRDKIVEHNPYADAIGRESVAKARLLKAAAVSQKNATAKMETKTPNDATNATTRNNSSSDSNSGPSPENAAAAAAGGDGRGDDGDDDDPMMGGVMGATVVERW